MKIDIQSNSINLGQCSWSSHRRVAKAQTSLRIRTDLPEPLIPVCKENGSRGRLGPNTRPLDSLCTSAWSFNSAPRELSHAFCRLLIFFQNQLFRKFLSGITLECQTDWIHIRPDVLSGLIPEVLSGLILVQSVCEGYEQETLVGKELNDVAFCLNLLRPCCDLCKTSHEVYSQVNPIRAHEV